MNLNKCVFGVASGMLLGHHISQRGIEVDSEKVKAIIEMPNSHIKKEVREFLGNLQYIK